MIRFDCDNYADTISAQESLQSPYIFSFFLFLNKNFERIKRNSTQIRTHVRNYIVY